MAYLDDTGLAYFWGKIKAWAQGLFALIGHTHPSSDVTAMTGYSKPASGSAVDAGDTLNQAVGKLEAKVDAADGLYVHLSGNEDVSGNKHFKNWCVMEDGFRMHEDKSAEFSKGSNPPATSYGTIFMVGDGGYSTGGDSATNRLLEYNCQINTSGVTKQIFKAFNNTANATDWAELVLVNDHGTAWAEAPTPASNANDTKIATTAWVRTHCSSTYLPLTGGTLSGNLNIKNASITRGTAPSSNAERVIFFHDSANNSTGAVSSIYFTDKSSRNAIYAYNTTVASGINIGYIGIGCNSSGNVYTVAPTPATADNSTQIATTAFVKAQGYITASGTCTGLTSRGNLGSSYKMNANDTAGVSLAVWGVGSFAANTTSVPPTGDVGDYAIMRMYTGAWNYANYLCASPRENRLFIGHQWSGADTFQGWNEIYTSAYSIILRGGNLIGRHVNNEQIYIQGGSGTDKSSYLVMNGGENTGHAGTFTLHAKTSSADKYLYGTPSGTLQWNGQNIQTTSDQRVKTKLSVIPDEILDAWDGVVWGQFQYLEAVSDKGSSARLHSGVVSQQIQETFSKKGLDACAYGFICHEVQDAVDTVHVVNTISEYVDENGVFHPEEKITELHHEDAVDLWMIRYTEALCMEAAYQRRENARLKKRVADLEDRLAALELRLGSE